MVEHDPSLKRRTVLSVAGAGILGSVVPGSSAATQKSDENPQEEKIEELLPENISEEVLVKHTKTGDEYVFDSTGDIGVNSLPAGEYRLEHHQRVDGELVVDNEYFTLDDAIETASDEATLDTVIDESRGYYPEGNIPVWVSTTTGTDEDISGSADATIEFEITDDEFEVVIEEQTTTDDDGVAFHELDLDLEEGEYSLDIEWVEEGLSTAHQFVVGPVVQFDFLSGPVGTDEEVSVPVSRTLENDPEPGTAEFELERPDGSSETLSVEINDGGVGLVEFEPTETGSHWLQHPSARFDVTIEVQNQRFRTESFRLRDQLVDEPIVYGGFILDDEVTPVDNESIEVELQQRHGEDEVLDSVETTTDGDGRFTVEFDPLSEADTYDVVVQSTDGEEIGSEWIRVNEVEEEDDPEPEVSVSIDEFDAVPDEEIATTIDLTDASDEPVEGDVTVIERIGFNGPILAINSVSTNEEGTAEYETSTPETFVETERFYVEAIANVNGEVISNNDSLRVESVDVNFSWGDVEAGGSVEREVTVTDLTTDEPVSDEDIGIVFARGHDNRGGAIEAGSGTTDNDGTVGFQFDVPDDVRYDVAFHLLYLPYEQIDTQFSDSVDSFAPSIEIPNEVSPGDSFKMEYTVDDHDLDTAAMFFVEKSDEAQVEIIDPGESVTVDVPTRMAGERVRTRTLVVDDDANLVQTFDNVSVTDEEVDPDPEVTAEFDFEPESPSVGEEVSFDASDSTATETSISSYEWDFTEDEEIDAEGEEVSYTFEEAGNIDVTLTVTGEDGITDSTTQTVTIVGEGTHESGVDQDVFDAVDQSDDGDVSLDELQDAVDDWGSDQQIDGVDTSLEDLRVIVDWWAS